MLDIDGVYAGTGSGNVTLDDNGTITNTTVTDSPINIQIFGRDRLRVPQRRFGNGQGDRR